MSRFVNCRVNNTVWDYFIVSNLFLVRKRKNENFDRLRRAENQLDKKI